MLRVIQREKACESKVKSACVNGVTRSSNQYLKNINQKVPVVCTQQAVVFRYVKQTAHRSSLQ